MVGIKVTWYWYEMKFYIHGLRIMGWYGFIGNMKEGGYEALVCDIRIYMYVHVKPFLID